MFGNKGANQRWHHAAHPAQPNSGTRRPPSSLRLGSPWDRPKRSEIPSRLPAADPKPQELTNPADAEEVLRVKLVWGFCFEWC